MTGVKHCRLFASLSFLVIRSERVAGFHGAKAELVAQRIHCALRRRAAGRLWVDEVRWIGGRRVAKLTDADTDQAEAGAISLVLQQRQPGGEYPVG
nr:hypothetical protein [Marinicella sp. W31]MDC2876512.1 hypothetical protein [Marinicella sp. W31]